MTLFRSFSLVFLLLLTGACMQQPPVPPLNLSAELPAVSARFVTERHHAHSAHNDQASTQGSHFDNEWHFWRNATRIEISIPRQHTGEAWLLDGSTIFYQKLFHADRKLVEYRMEDLSALNVKMNWRTNALMIDPAVLQQLQVTGEDWIDGHPALELTGTVDAITYAVVWLVDVNLPYSLEQHDASGNHERTRLQELHSTGDSALAAPNSRDYEIIDYADLGDRERDPFVLKIQGFLPGGQVHLH